MLVTRGNMCGAGRPWMSHCGKCLGPCVDVMLGGGVGYDACLCLLLCVSVWGGSAAVVMVVVVGAGGGREGDALHAPCPLSIMFVESSWPLSQHGS